MLLIIKWKLKLLLKEIIKDLFGKIYSEQSLYIYITLIKFN